MKKALFLFCAFAAVALAFQSCVLTQPEESVCGETTVQFTAGMPDTRTAFTTPEGDGYPVLWTANDSEVKISLKMLNTVSATVTPSLDGRSATFSATFGTDFTAPYIFDLISPASAYAYDNAGKWRIRLPAEQTPTAQSVDEKVQILVAQSESFQEMPKKVNFSLKHWTAYGLLNFENLALGSASITSVELTAEKPWAGGSWEYDTHNGKTEVYSGAGNTITIRTSSATGIWFACAPVDLSGTKLSFRVKTDAGDFVKEVTLPADRNLTSGKVARITVDMAGITPAEPKVTRIIKFFPTAWPSAIGVGANQDRTAAMDEEYIYVARAGLDGVKGVKAMSLADPSVVKDVNIEGVEGGDFITSCVRTIYDPVRGKHILLLSSMAMDYDHPVRIYAYENGIDNPPTLLVNFPVGGYRRFGDFFTVVGDYQHGYLWFRNFQSEKDFGVSARFELIGGQAKNQWPDGFTIGYEGSKGMGSLYQYDMDAKVILLVTDKVGLFYKLSDPPTVDYWGQNLAQESFCRMYGIKPFEFGGKKYIAYVKMKNDNAARSWLRVVKDTGDFKTDLENSIKTDPTNLVYEAAIQIDEEGHSENVVSGATWSGNTMANCDVIVKEDAVFIMAHHQNVGLSVFKMSYE